MSEAVAKLSYTVDEAARAIGVSRSTVYKLFRIGELRNFRWGGRVLIHRLDLSAYIERRDNPPAPETPPPLPRCGIYMLFAAGALVYAGRSTNLRERLATHRRSGREFDDAKIIECDLETAIWLERELIRTLQPVQNLMRYQRLAKIAEREQSEVLAS